MAKKVLKTRTQFTSTLENSLLKDLRDMSDTTHIPISRLLDLAVRDFLTKKDQHST